MYKKNEQERTKLHISIKQMSFVNKKNIKLFLLIKDICAIKIYKFYEILV